MLSEQQPQVLLPNGLTQRRSKRWGKPYTLTILLGDSDTASGSQRAPHTHMHTQTHMHLYGCVRGSCSGVLYTYVLTTITICSKVFVVAEKSHTLRLVMHGAPPTSQTETHQACLVFFHFSFLIEIWCLTFHTSPCHSITCLWLINKSFQFIRLPIKKCMIHIHWILYTNYIICQ